MSGPSGEASRRPSSVPPVGGVVTARYRVFDPLLDPADADAMIRALRALRHLLDLRRDAAPTSAARCASRPSCPQRYDAALQLREDGRSLRRSARTRAVLAARTNYFRETYAYGDEATRRRASSRSCTTRASLEAARQLHGRADRRAGDRLREPAAARPGARRPHRRARVPRRQPQAASRSGSCVVMHHSGLFDALAHARSRPASRTSATAPAASSPSTPTAPTAPPQTLAGAHNTGDPDRHRHGLPRRRPRRVETTRAADCRARHAPAPRRRRHAGRALRRRARARHATAGTSCASRSRGRRTASPTRPSAARRAPQDDLALDRILDDALRRPARARPRSAASARPTATSRAPDRGVRALPRRQRLGLRPPPSRGRRAGCRGQRASSGRGRGSAWGIRRPVSRENPFPWSGTFLPPSQQDGFRKRGLHRKTLITKYIFDLRVLPRQARTLL